MELLSPASLEEAADVMRMQEPFKEAADGDRQD